MTALTLVLGGARSGKSSFAASSASWSSSSGARVLITCNWRRTTSPAASSSLVKPMTFTSGERRSWLTM